MRMKLVNICKVYRTVSVILLWIEYLCPYLKFILLKPEYMVECSRTELVPVFAHLSYYNEVP